MFKGSIMKVPNEEIINFFNTPRQRESQARIAKVKVECAEIQTAREARLIAAHNFEDCMGDDCWICDTAARERAEGVI